MQRFTHCSRNHVYKWKMGVSPNRIVTFQIHWCCTSTVIHPPKKNEWKSPKKRECISKGRLSGFQVRTLSVGSITFEASESPPRWVMFLGFCSTFTNLPNLSCLHNLYISVDGLTQAIHRKKQKLKLVEIFSPKNERFSISTGYIASFWTCLQLFWIISLGIGVKIKNIWNHHLLQSFAPYLPETNMAPENRPSQKERIVFQPSIFKCKLAVSFRECTFFRVFRSFAFHPSSMDFSGSCKGW